MPEAYINVGSFRCYPLIDGDLHYPTAALFPGRSDEELTAVVRSEGESDKSRVQYSGLLIDTGRHKVLIDTGAGPLAPSTGRLLQSLVDCGISPEEIDFVILSHLHADHIGGLLTDDSKFVFPNAEILLSNLEHKFWMSEKNQAKLQGGELFGLGELETVLLTWVRKYILPLGAAERLRLIDAETELITGVRLLPAFGHTPGHLAVLVANGNQQLLFGGDTFLHPAHVKHPEWTAAFDVSAEGTVQTRRKILDRAASDQCPMFLLHFPFPSLGNVSHENGRYRWEPIEI